MPRCPNILWIQTDEQRPDSLGCYGSTWARTPNVDRIARRGAVMQNAVCQSPVCLPSRSSQLSGRYPQEFACLNNMLAAAGETFPEPVQTFPEIFRDAGYDTRNYGRYHCLKPGVFETNCPTPDCLPEVGNPFRLADDYDENSHHVLKRPGKHHRELIIAGTYPEGAANSCQLSTDRAIAFLRNRAADAPPFLLRVSYNWPHTPTLAPLPYDRLYDPETLPVRSFSEKAYAGRAAYDRAYADLHLMRDLTPAQVGQVWKDYMGLCAYVDSEAGRLLATLEDLGLLENTIILYSADHGKSLGEWGSGEKGTFDRDVWRVPMIWSFPGSIPEGDVRTEPAEIIDTGRTLLALAGLEDRIPTPYRGRNLFGNGPAADAAFGVIRPPVQDLPDFPADLMRVAVRTNRFRLDMNWGIDGSIPAPGQQDGNLFDLHTDPYEEENLWDSPGQQSAKQALIRRLDAWIRRHELDPRLRPENAGTLF